MSTPALAGGKMTVVLGSKPNGMPPGLGLHAEFRALSAAGLTPEQALRAAVNTTIQGTAADLMKLAMLKVEAALDEAIDTLLDEVGNRG